PAGHSPHLIVGATHETDLNLIHVANSFYKQYDMRRVYYSGYVPVLEDNRLPSLNTQVPVQREHRLYQAEWLMRF
ncbi:putative DNA modification/repair radical SAM protein, partial [Ornithobacterium rhinotracheale]